MIIEYRKLNITILTIVKLIKIKTIGNRAYENKIWPGRACMPSTKLNLQLQFTSLRPIVRNWCCRWYNSKNKFVALTNRRIIIGLYLYTPINYSILKVAVRMNVYNFRIYLSVALSKNESFNSSKLSYGSMWGLKL